MAVNGVTAHGKRLKNVSPVRLLMTRQTGALSGVMQRKRIRLMKMMEMVREDQKKGEAGATTGVMQLMNARLMCMITQLWLN